MILLLMNRVESWSRESSECHETSDSEIEKSVVPSVDGVHGEAFEIKMINPKVAILCPRTLGFFRSLSGGVGVSERLLFRVQTR